VLCRYGDYLGSGWCNILDCLVRMHALGLLPAALLRTEAESPEAAAARLPKAAAPNRSGSSGVLYRALTRRAHRGSRPCLHLGLRGSGLYGVRAEDFRALVRRTPVRVRRSTLVLPD
jgi:hypothetical protein